MKTIYVVLLLFILPACSLTGSFRYPHASGHYVSDIVQCVPYARRVSGINLYGDADSWWWNAQGKYARGNTPAEGAVLVLKTTPRMRSGHVAVVKEVLSARQINVTHSNWGNNKKRRSIIYDSMLAQDVSGANDWTQVRFWNVETVALGFPYAAYGFIYKQ
jgi:hypothetical protein